MQINEYIGEINTFQEINIFRTNILIKKKQNQNYSYSSNSIFNYFNDYGKQILKIVNKNFLVDQTTTEEQMKSLLNFFKNFFKRIGYINTNTDTIDNKTSFIIVPEESIITLTKNFIKFYIFYELYNLLEQNNLNDIIIKEDLTLFQSDFDIKNFSKVFLLDIIDKELEPYMKKVKVKLNIDSYNQMTYIMISNNLYAIGLYALVDRILLINNDRESIKCQHCGKIVTRKHINQKNCPNCAKKIKNTSGQITDKKKLEVIQELNKYKKLYKAPTPIEQREFNTYCDLTAPGKSRTRLTTKLSDLEETLKIVKKQVDNIDYYSKPIW